MGRKKTPPKMMGVRNSAFQLDKVQRSLNVALAASEQHLSQMQSAAHQINLEIQRLKAVLLAQELLRILRGITQSPLDIESGCLREVAKFMIQSAEFEKVDFEDLLLGVQMLLPLLSKEQKKNRFVAERNLTLEKGRAAEGLKILYVTGMFPSDKHGGGLRVRDILSKLTLRHQVDLYSIFNSAIDRASFEEVCKSVRASRLCEDEKIFGPTDILGWLKRRGIGPGYYDVIQFEYPRSVALIKSLKPFGKRHGYTLMESITRHHFQNFQRFLGTDVQAAAASALNLLEAVKIEGDALRNTDFSVAVTEADAAFTQKTFGSLPHVVPTGLNESFFKYARLKGSSPFPNPSKCKSVIFLGYFDHSPNRDGVQWYLRQVHPLICRRHPSYHFYVVGAGAKAWVDELRHQHIHDKQVSVIGYLEEFRPLLSACKISVAPLISGAGIRGKINQYSALEVPTVATELAACGTDYLHGESIMISKNSSQFARQLSLLLTKESLRKKIASNAMTLVKKKYLWGDLVRKLEDVYVNC
ncbi:MAG: glycosyltransferase family 4 protein [Bdellovibrionales bacterium]|nr:glycosyltransferase family 4 protein [Bdellovibrionales bacterium]